MLLMIILYSHTILKGLKSWPWGIGLTVSAMNAISLNWQSRRSGTEQDGENGKMGPIKFPIKVEEPVGEI